MVNLCDVRVVQRRERLGFATESGETFGVTREGVWEDLDGDIAPELRIARAIHLAHPTFAHQGEDLEGTNRCSNHRQISKGPSRSPADSDIRRQSLTSGP